MMKLIQDKKITISIALALFVFGTILLLIPLFSSEKTTTPLPSADSQTEGFTFFNVGANTTYSDGIREALNERLGSGVLETRGTIDLRAGEPDFLKIHYPDIHRFSSYRAIETDILRCRMRLRF